MKITEVRNKVRQDLLDVDPEAQIYNNESVDRAFLSALEDFARFVPDEKFYELTVNGSLITESFNTTTLALTKPYTIDLGNKLVRYQSETVTVGATTYTRDTDYSMDYINGAITVPASSGIANGATIQITYYLSKYLFDISSLTNLRQITSVESWLNQGRVPQQFSGFSLKGWILAVLTTGDQSQQDIPANQHVVVHYDSRYTMPDDNNDGTLPEAFVEIIIRGATANLLFAKAISLELAQSAISDDLSDTATYFTEAQALFTAITTDLASARSTLALAITQMASAVSQAGDTITGIASDIVDIQADLAETITSLNLVSTKAELGEDAVDAEVASDLALLAGENTNVVAVLGNSATRLTSAASDLALAFNWLDLAEDDREAGESIINQVNIGLDPVGRYVQFASMIQQNADRDIAAANSLVQQASAYTEQAIQFINMAQMYATSAATRIKLAETYYGISDRYIAITDEYLKRASIRVQILQGRIQFLGELINLSRGYVDIAGGFHSGYLGLVQEIDATIGLKLNEIQTKVAVSAEYRSQRTLILEISERIRQEATRRYTDFYSLISDRNQTRRSNGSIATSQLGAP